MAELFDTADPLLDPETGLTRLDLPTLSDPTPGAAKFRTHYTIVPTDVAQRNNLLVSYQAYQETLISYLDKPEDLTAVARAVAFMLLISRIQQSAPDVLADYYVGVTDVIVTYDGSPLNPAFLLISQTPEAS